MATEVEAHETNTSMVQVPLAEVQGSTDVMLKAKISCPCGCDLWGGTVRVLAHDGTVAKEAVIVSFDGTANETDEFVVRAPFEPGEYTWTALFPAQKRRGIPHEESSAPFSFIVKPHTSGIEVWDLPAAIAIGDEFKIKIGVTCSSECNLAGQKIEIYDHAGAKVATGTLGDLPWPGTAARYWTEVQLEAPAIEGRHTWKVRHPRPKLELPHEEVSQTFVFVTARQAEHLVTIEVIEKDTKAPIKGAHLRLRPRLYRGSSYMTDTDEAGLARLQVPSGVYHLYVWDDQYEKVVPTVKVEGDLAIKAELTERIGSWREYPH